MAHWYLSFLILPLCSTISPGQTSLDLDDFLWKNRVLIAFVQDTHSPPLSEFKDRITRERDGFLDRDLVFIEILQNGQSRVDGSAITSASANNIVRRYRVDFDNFSVYLIGKDGGVKLRGDSSTRLTDIFSLIDTMPMRRAEMERKNQ